MISVPAVPSGLSLRRTLVRHIFAQPGSWKLEAGSRKLEVGNQKMEKSASYSPLTIHHSPLACA